MFQLSDNPKKGYSSLKIIFFAMFAGLLTFLFVALFLSNEEIKELETMQNSLVLALLGLTLIAIPVGMKVSGNAIRKIDKNLPLNEKINGFSSAWIIRMAVLEGTTLFSIIALLITYDYRFLFIAILLLMFFLMNFPSISKMAQLLHLSGEEIQSLS